MSDILEFLFSEPKLLIIVVSVALGWAVGSHLGIMAGLTTFGASLVGLGIFVMVRVRSKSR